MIDLLYDKDIREPLFDFLEAYYGKVRILEEKQIGRSRADIMMVISSHVVGIEIKSDAGRLIFTVKGSGHGLGMSQFGANELALEGWDYGKILNYFFQGVSFTKME